MIPISYVFTRKEIHVLPKAITLRYEGMALEIAVFVFGFVLVVGWYLE